MDCSGKIWHFKFYSNAVSGSLDIAQQCKVHFNINVSNWFFLTHVNLKLIPLYCTFLNPNLPAYKDLHDLYFVLNMLKQEASKIA